MIHGRFPLPDLEWPGTAEFWAAAQVSELRIPRCDACMRWVWYPKPECPDCGRDQHTWTQTSGRGTLHTWAVVRHVFLEAFADDVPYITGLVALEEDALIRLPARILAPADMLEIDMPVRVTFQPMTFRNVDGQVMAPFFVPADDSVSAGETLSTAVRSGAR